MNFAHVVAQVTIVDLSEKSLELTQKRAAHEISPAPR